MKSFRIKFIVATTTFLSSMTSVFFIQNYSLTRFVYLPMLFSLRGSLMIFGVEYCEDVFVGRKEKDKMTIFFLAKYTFTIFLYFSYFFFLYSWGFLSFGEARSKFLGFVLTHFAFSYLIELIYIFSREVFGEDAEMYLFSLIPGFSDFIGFLVILDIVTYRLWMIGLVAPIAIVQQFIGSSHLRESGLRQLMFAFFDSNKRILRKAFIYFLLQTVELLFGLGTTPPLYAFPIMNLSNVYLLLQMKFYNRVANKRLKKGNFKRIFLERTLFAPLVYMVLSLGFFRFFDAFAFLELFILSFLSLFITSLFLFFLQQGKLDDQGDDPFAITYPIISDNLVILVSHFLV